MDVKTERTWQRSQSLWSETVADIDAGVRGATLAKATIRRNAYDEQSFARVEVWIPGLGWAQALTRTLDEVGVLDLTYVLKPGQKQWEDRMLAANLRLLNDAEEMFA